MDISATILVLLSTITALGAIVAYFTRARGMSTIDLLQKNIDAYKDHLRLKDEEISYLRGQLDIKERIIERLSDDGNPGKK